MELKYDIPTENKQYGKSNENKYSDCRNCCFCDRAAPLTWCETVSVQMFIKDPPLLPIHGDEGWQIEIDSRVDASQASTYDNVSQRYGYRQIIHRKCLHILSNGESEALRAKNKNNIYVPEFDGPGVVLTLNYRDCRVPRPRKSHPVKYKYDPFSGDTFVGYDDEVVGANHAPERGLYNCIRCSTLVDSTLPGFAYPNTDTRSLNYIHYMCYEKHPLTVYQEPYYDIPTCARCDEILDERRPGLSYPSNKNAQKIKFLHFSCCVEIREIRKCYDVVK
jgi:hypothetical protein